MDYRLEQDEWKQPGVGNDWQPVQVLESPTKELIPRDLPPVRRLRELKPVKSWQVGAKTWLFDLGENITGWVRLALDEPSGSTVRIRYSEMAKDGKIWNTPGSHWWCHGMTNATRSSAMESRAFTNRVSRSKDSGILKSAA